MNNRKKIGCVIAYRKNHTNYGTSLVGYSLLKTLGQLGYEIEVINYVKHLSILQKMSYILNALRCGEVKTIYNRRKAIEQTKSNPLYAQCLEERVNAVETYKANKLIPFFHNYKGFESLQKASNQYDAVVVGSDQVWSPLSLPNKYYNLLFVDDNVRKIAYASSFGVSEIPLFQQKATGTYLDRFYKIGVREQSGKNIVDTLSHQTATVVIDPTLLLNRDEWKEEIKDSKVQETEPYIFCYFLGTNMEARKAANELKSKTGYKIITIRHMDEYVSEDEFFGDEAPYNVNPNDFVKYISEAVYVCTDSFHCTAFSIQFHRKFMTFYRFAKTSKTSRNSRIDSLFKMLGIDNRRIYDGEICNTIDLPIDYNSIDRKLNKLRDCSIKFLKTSLE